MGLKPCPFCGGEAVLIPLSVCNGYVSCIGDCGIHTQKFWSESMSDSPEDRVSWKDLATEAWNRRV